MKVGQLYQNHASEMACILAGLADRLAGPKPEQTSDYLECDVRKRFPIGEVSSKTQFREWLAALKCQIMAVASRDDAEALSREFQERSQNLYIASDAMKRAALIEALASIDHGPLVNPIPTSVLVAE